MLHVVVLVRLELTLHFALHNLSHLFFHSHDLHLLLP